MQVPYDGGKQVDFSGGARPIIQKRLREWLYMGVIRQVD